MAELIEQENTSGAVLHVPALGVEVGPGDVIKAPVLIPGFTRTIPAPDPDEKPAKKTAAKPSVKE